ncbi:MAG: MFS transporter [Actinobacteria bacterium]|nr:MFS transporter [Actinomycetota bacterium]
MAASRATVQAPPQAAAARSAAVTLGIILACQLMIGLDVTIVNVALPKIQESLHFSAVGQSWVLNSYALAFGGLVLLGGRAGDILGRRRVFLAGIALFAVASLAGGSAPQGWELIIARAVQGAAAAFAAPSALALLMVNFPDQERRTRALALYSIVTALGTSAGLILGGVLVSWASWRWVLFVNVPVAVVVLVLTPRFVRTMPANAGRFDAGGAVTSTAGMALLIFGSVHGATNGWGGWPTIAALAGGAVLLCLFFFIETHVSQPVTPLWLFRDANRAGGYAIIFLVMAALYSLYFFGTQFMEDVLAYSPLRTGLSFLVTTLAAVVAARATARLLPHFGARATLVAAATLTLAGSIWMTQLSASSSYLAGLAGPLLLFGLGIGLSVPALNVTILAGIQPRDSGAASGLLQAMQFTGGTIGLALLVAIYGTALERPMRGASELAAAHSIVAHGIATAYIAGALMTGAALVVAALVVRKRVAPAPAAAE